MRLLLLTLAALPLTAQIRFLPQTSGVQASLRGLAAVNARTAWASGTGGTVLLTTDGATWQRRPVPGAEALDFRDIEAFNARRAILLAAGPGEKSRLYRTRDGGATWQLLRTNTDPQGFWDAIAFSNEKHGVLLGDPVNGHFVIETTADGGQTWQRRPTPLRQPTPSAGIFSLALGPGPTAVAVGGDYRQPEQTSQTAAFTPRHGATWTPAPGLRGYRSGAAFFTRTTVIAVGTNGADLSTDGGQTWQPLAAEGYHAVQRGWAVGAQGRIARVTLR